MSYRPDVGIGSAPSKRKRTWACGSELALDLAIRERAALVKDCAVLGGMLASSIRTVARRLQAAPISQRADRGRRGVGMTYSSTLALAMNESTMRFL